MSKTINSDLIRGNINTIILKSLYDGDRYGYDIIREIEEKSHGQYILKQPTLYSCLKRLESQGFINSYWGEQSNGGRRKYYTLTDMGREVFVKNQDEYEFSRTIIDQLISERDYDLDSVEKPTSDNEDMSSDSVDAYEDIETDVKEQPSSVTEIASVDEKNISESDENIEFFNANNENVTYEEAKCSAEETSEDIKPSDFNTSQKDYTLTEPEHSSPSKLIDEMLQSESDDESYS